MHEAPCLWVFCKVEWLWITLGVLAEAGYDQSRRQTGSQSIMRRLEEPLQSSLPISTFGECHQQ